MVKPGGTGKPRLAISARPAPLPPKRLPMSARPSAFPLPTGDTHSGLGWAAAGARSRAAAWRPDAGRGDILFDRVRRDVTMEPRTSMRPALMITAAGADARAQFGRPAAGVSADEVIDAVQSNEADDDQVDGDDVVQQSRHDQDQNAGDEGNQRRNVGNGDSHEDLLGRVMNYKTR